MIEIKRGFLIKGIRIPIPTFHISKLPITKELWKTAMNDDKKRYRVEWYEYVIRAKTNLSHSFEFLHSKRRLFELCV